MAPCNGTQQWHHVHSTIAHYNGTLQWHPAMAPRPLHPAMAFWCHVQCAKVVRRPPPLLEVRTPIAIAIWGKKDAKQVEARNFLSSRNPSPPGTSWSKAGTFLLVLWNMWCTFLLTNGHHIPVVSPWHMSANKSTMVLNASYDHLGQLEFGWWHAKQKTTVQS